MDSLAIRVLCPVNKGFDGVNTVAFNYISIDNMHPCDFIIKIDNLVFSIGSVFYIN